MKKLLVGAAAVIAVCIGSGAYAADLGVAPVYKAPPAPPPATWTGFYVGGNVGYGWAHDDSTRLPPGTVSFPVGFPSSQNQKGGLAGGQAGFDFQFNQFVVGVVADGDFANLTGSSSDPAVVGTRISTSFTGIHSIVDVGGRAGIAWWNNFLPYVKGGGAWERVDIAAIDTVAGAQTTSATGSATRSGWFIGIGGEYKGLFTPSVSVFAEYDHYDFGTATETRTVISSSELPVGTPRNLSVTRRTDVVKVGVNWRPAWIFGK